LPFKVSFPLETRLSKMYEPGAWIARVSPRPLLMIIAQADHITLTDLKLRAYEDALEPKKLVTIEGISTSTLGNSRRRAARLCPGFVSI
jgi:fermentation-respiration switch protein FrsA (DUF1100 family)